MDEVAWFGPLVPGQQRSWYHLGFPGCTSFAMGNCAWAMSCSWDEVARCKLVHYAS
jgi:hypothetical protein